MISVRVRLHVRVKEIEAPSPTAERISVTTGLVCRNCGERVWPVVMNDEISRPYTHLHRPFRFGAGVFCDNGKTKARPFIKAANR